MRFEKSEHCKHHHHMHHRHGGFGRDFEFGPRGPWSAGFGPGGFGGPGGRGRRRRGDVRLGLLLVLNEEGSKNGYQLIQALSDRSEGEWTPSPGSVYPTLSQLEDEGLISATAKDGESGRYYDLTDSGRAYLETLGDRKAPWEQDSDETDPRWQARKAIGQTVKAAVQVFQDGDPDKIAKTLEILAQARKDIYRILAEDDQ